MIAWRIAIKQFSSPLMVLSGNGAKETGNRWNHPGHAVAYCAENLSLAFLEYLVGVDGTLLPNDLMKIKIELPDNSIEQLKIDHPVVTSLGRTHGRDAKDYGTNWLQESRSLILKVPSVVIPDECNVLINPLHPETDQIKILKAEPLIVDSRLFQ